MSNLKMYIAVHTDVPDHMVPVVVAHAVLGAHIEFTRVHSETGNYIYWFSAGQYNEWLDESFKKVVVRVNEKEFQKILAMDFVYKGHENTVMNGEPCCIVVCPREEYPNVIKFAKAWEPIQVRTSAFVKE